MAIPVGTIIEIVQEGLLVGQRCLTTYHYIVNNQSSTPDGVVELTNLLEQHWNAGVDTISRRFIDCVPDNYELLRTSAQAVHPVRARKVPLGMAHQGSRPAAVTGNLQASVTTVTNLAGRRQVGGKRVPLSQADSQDGRLAALYIPILLLYAVEIEAPLVVAIGGGEYVPVIYHRPPAPEPRFDLITDAFVQETTRVLRRRTVGLGI